MGQVSPPSPTAAGLPSVPSPAHPWLLAAQRPAAGCGDVALCSGVPCREGHRALKEVCKAMPAPSWSALCFVPTKEPDRLPHSNGQDVEEHGGNVS